MKNVRKLKSKETAIPQPIYKITLFNKLTSEEVYIVTESVDNAHAIALDCINGGPYKVTVEACVESELDQGLKNLLKKNGEVPTSNLKKKR